MSLAFPVPDDLLALVEHRARQMFREEVERALQPASPWMNVKSAAAYLDMSEDALRSLVKRKEIAVYRSPNGTLRFRQEDLDAHAQGHVSKRGIPVDPAAHTVASRGLWTDHAGMSLPRPLEA